MINVRFIAIANGVDNINPESGEFVLILNVMNEWCLRDQSRKMTAAYKQKGNAGLPINNNCIYGYKKDPEQKNHWLVDEEAAQVVRRIYQMACEGHRPYEIARILTREKALRKELRLWLVALNGCFAIAGQGVSGRNSELQDGEGFLQGKANGDIEG